MAKLVKNNNKLLDEDILKSILRNKRARLLDAFDKWEKAVIRGREQDDESIMIWYKQVLDLVAEAYDNVPARIEYYVRRDV